MRPSRAIPLALLLAVAVRLPFWIEALRTPVDGDTAIIGLMARHLGAGTTMWGQPYGSPLDAWVVWPFVQIWGCSTDALRLPYFLLALALVPLAYALARLLHPEAALPAAVLMACPPPYFLLFSALPQPLYPTTLVLCGLVLALAVHAGRRLDASEAPASAPRGTLLAGGSIHGQRLTVCQGVPAMYATSSLTAAWSCVKSASSPWTRTVWSPKPTPWVVICTPARDRVPSSATEKRHSSRRQRRPR